MTGMAFLGHTHRGNVCSLLDVRSTSHVLHSYPPLSFFRLLAARPFEAEEAAALAWQHWRVYVTAAAAVASWPAAVLARSCISRVHLLP